MDFKDYIDIIESYPRENVSFKDINSLVKKGEIFKAAVDELIENIRVERVDYVVGPEARGFLFGAPVAYGLGIGFVPVRKSGKLPGQILSYSYELEYGVDSLEIQEGAIEPGSRVVIVDDLLATGGTINATAKLLESLGAEVVSMEFLIELKSLKGRKKNKGYKIRSLVSYD